MKVHSKYVLFIDLFVCLFVFQFATRRYID